MPLRLVSVLLRPWIRPEALILRAGSCLASDSSRSICSWKVRIVRGKVHSTASFTSA